MLSNMEICLSNVAFRQVMAPTQNWQKYFLYALPGQQYWHVDDFVLAQKIVFPLTYEWFVSIHAWLIYSNLEEHEIMLAKCERLWKCYFDCGRQTMKVFIQGIAKSALKYLSVFGFFHVCAQCFYQYVN